MENTLPFQMIDVTVTKSFTSTARFDDHPLIEHAVFSFSLPRQRHPEVITVPFSGWD
jgi:hypothetical protein